MWKHTKAIALNSDLETSQAFIYTRDNTYLAFLISSAGENIFTTVRQAAADLYDSFFDSTESIPTRIDEGFANLKEALKDAEDSQILIASWGDTNVLYLKGEGDQRAYLYRQSSVIPLVSIENQSTLISGFIEPGDKFLLVNSNFDEHLEDKKPLFNSQVESLEEEVEEVVRQKPNGPPIAGIFIDNQTQETPSETSPEDPNLPNIESSIISEPGARPDILALIKDNFPKNPKARLIMAGAAAIAVLIILVLVSQSKSNSQKNLQFQNSLTSAQTEYATAQSLKDSNPDEAKKSLINAKSSLDQALALKPTDASAKALKQEIDQNSNSILKVATITNWPLFLDLNLLKQNFQTNRLSLSVGQLLMLDTNQKTLVELSLDKKTKQILAGQEQFGAAQQASLNGDFAFVNSQDKGIIKIDTNTLKATTAASKDTDWGNIADIYAFAGNFYLLDSIKNQIWKYTPSGSGYAKFTYLKDGVKADFSGGKRMQIDSSIWILDSGGVINRYTAGSPDEFSPGGLDKNIKQITSFFVSGDTDNIYIMDSSNSRVVILKKNGQYVSQLEGDKFKTASDLVVDEKAKVLYLLESNKIYQVGLP